MTLEANEVERIYVEILLGIPRSESLVRMRPEVERFWDELSAEIAQMRADGKGFLVPNEFPDVLPTKDTEVRFNPQQPRAPDGKWTSGGGGAAAGDTGGDTPSGSGDSSDDGGEEPDVDDIVGDEEYAKLVSSEIADEQMAYRKEEIDPMTADVIEDYTRFGHHSVNRRMRGAPPPPIEDEFDEDTIDEIDVRVDMLTMAVDGVPPLQRPVTLFRGVNAKALGKEVDVDDDSALKSLIGSTFTDNGIISATPSLDVASNFGGGRRSVLLEVRAPVGTRAMAVEPLSANQPEYEFLMPPGSRFNIIGIGEREGSTVIITELDN